MRRLSTRAAAWLSAAGLLVGSACAERPAPPAGHARATSVEAMRTTSASTAECTTDSTLRIQTPRALLTEVLAHNDSGFTTGGTSPEALWIFKAVLCEQDVNGSDEALLVFDHSVDSLARLADTVSFRITYRAAATLSQDSLGFVLLDAPPTVVDTLRLVSTRYGWKLRDDMAPRILLSVGRARFRFRGAEHIRADSLGSPTAGPPGP